VKLDNEFNQLVGANGILNGGSTSNRIYTIYNHATEPVATWNQTGAGPIAVYQQGGVTKATITNAGALSLAAMTACPNVNADQVDGIEGANIAKLDTHQTAFSYSFGIADPSTPATSAVIPGAVAFVCPDGQSVTATKLKVRYDLGSHTTGGSVTFAVELRTASSGWGTNTTIGTVTLDNTNNSLLTVYTNDIADQALAAGDTLICFISARSGTVTERNVSVVVVGKQKFTT